MSKVARGRLNLHTTIALLFIVLLVGLGGALGWYRYAKFSELLLALSDQSSNQITQELSLDYRGIYRPLAQTINVLSRSQIAKVRSLE